MRAYKGSRGIAPSIHNLTHQIVTTAVGAEWGLVWDVLKKGNTFIPPTGNRIQHARLEPGTRNLPGILFRDQIQCTRDSTINARNSEACVQQNLHDVWGSMPQAPGNCAHFCHTARRVLRVWMEERVLRTYWIRSREQPTRGGPPIWAWGRA